MWEFHRVVMLDVKSIVENRKLKDIWLGMYFSWSLKGFLDNMNL